MVLHADAEVLIDIARVYAASAEAESFAENPDAETVATWKQRAVSLIDDAVTQGYRDFVYLAGEPDFASIRSRPEFKKWLERGSTK